MAQFLKPHTHPRDNDSEGYDGYGEFDFEAREAVRLSCRFESRSITPSSGTRVNCEGTTRPRASPDVIDGIVEKLRHAKVG